MEEKLYAGASSIVVNLDEKCFPNAESIKSHDNVYVRVIIIKANKKFCFLSADMPSMFPPDVRYCKELLKNRGFEDENSWITVSHSLSAPHTWPVGGNEQKDTMLPPVFTENPKMLDVADRINEAYKKAYNTAIDTALSNMEEASVGFGKGQCRININRNVLTNKGWWQGVNHEGFADPTLTALRFNRKDGSPIAIIYNYSVQSSVAAGKFPDAGGRISSSDLAGAASLYVENEYKNCTTMILCGATSDQVPLYKINHIVVDKDGNYSEQSFGEAGFVLLEAQGKLLGESIINVSETIDNYHENTCIFSDHITYTCNCQRRDSDMGKLRPVHEYKYIPDGTRDLTVSMLLLGDIALVGLIPEMDGITISDIRNGSPYEKTMVASFINGNGKSMPAAESYDKFHYAALNSPFVKGSAEKTRDIAISYLNELHAKRK